MIWLVWDSNETEADAKRIDAQDCVEAAEEWARRDGDADPANIEGHLRHGLDLRARVEDGDGTAHRVVVTVVAEVHYSGREAIR